MEVTVREADWIDGEAVRDVHVASIEGLAGRAYDDAIVAAWAGGREPADYPIDARETHFVVAESEANRREASMASGERAVDRRATADSSSGERSDPRAESEANRREASMASGERSDPRADRGDRLLGFGTLNREPGEYFRQPVDGEITAVYVRPSVAREGVGSRIYDDLEGRARDEGLGSLGLVASRNAIPFYEAHGYERIRERPFEFDDGVEGTVVEMRKPLDT